MSRDFIIKKNAPLAAMKVLPILKDLGDENWDGYSRVNPPLHRPSLSRSKNSFSFGGGVLTPKSTKETNSNTSLKTHDREPSTTASHNSLHRPMSKSRIFALDTTNISTPKSSNPLISKFPGASLAQYLPYGAPEDFQPKSPGAKDKTSPSSARNLVSVKQRQFARLSSFKLEPLSALDSSPRTGFGLKRDGSFIKEKDNSDCLKPELVSGELKPKMQNFMVSAFLESKIVERSRNKVHASQRSFRVDKREASHTEGPSKAKNLTSQEDMLYRSDVGPSSPTRQDTILTTEKSKSSSPARREAHPAPRHLGEFVSSVESVQGVSSNKEKPNQDYYAERDFTLGLPTAATDGYPVRIRIVADGHGVNGHLIARLASERLATLMEQEMKLHYKLGALVLDGGDLAVEFLRRTIKKCFVDVDKQLESSNICMRLSGATLTLALICLGHLFLANVGDSTAILISKQSNQNLAVTAETPVHHPDDKEERARIIESGGLVASSRSKDGEHEGPLRVWRKDMMGPGLAVTRSFGDRDGRLLGVICTPGRNTVTLDVIVRRLSTEDKALVLGSDGLWEHMNHKTLIAKVMPSMISTEPEQGVQSLLRYSLDKWQEVNAPLIQKFHSRDDITICLMYFV